MNTTSLKCLLDACFAAKRIVETLPALPKGMKPRHIHVLEAIYEVNAERSDCRVSDVSTRLNITAPSITKLIQELEGLGLVEKCPSQSDKRVVHLYLTNEGLACVREHVLDFHRDWAAALGSVTDEQASETARVIGELMRTMPGKRQEAQDGQRK